MPASPSGTSVCILFVSLFNIDILLSLFRLVKAIQVKLQDPEQPVVVPVFVTANQQQLLVADQVQRVVVQVQVFGVFIQKIHQVLKLALYLYLS
jgi:hypothetical protein